MKASIIDIRRHMSKVLRALDRNETVTLTYRGRDKAVIVPKKSDQKVDIDNHPAFGLWKHREDMDNVERTVRHLRRGRFDAV